VARPGGRASQTALFEDVPGDPAAQFVEAHAIEVAAQEQHTAVVEPVAGLGGTQPPPVSLG
jgi:acetylornithine/succinyldiaminopimelate/putrescine aminotransferase